MKNKELETKILQLADKAGIHGSRVFEVDKSIDTNMVNAYVTGFGGSKRIVLWDTLLEKLDDEEVLVVMGHEMGHYVLGHIVKDLLLTSAASFLLFYFLYKVAPFIQRKYKKRFGFKKLDDIASYPLFMLLFTFFTFVFDPISNGISRHFEKEADAFALKMTQNPHAGATTFVKLQQSNLANPYPGPIYIFLRASHPPIGERVAFFNKNLNKDD
jgi:Zn-dependent protease with chaperone function